MTNIMKFEETDAETIARFEAENKRLMTLVETLQAIAPLEAAAITSTDRYGMTAVFLARELPAGTKLFTHSPEAEKLDKLYTAARDENVRLRKELEAAKREIGELMDRRVADKARLELMVEAELERYNEFIAEQFSGFLEAGATGTPAEIEYLRTLIARMGPGFHRSEMRTALNLWLEKLEQDNYWRRLIRRIKAWMAPYVLGKNSQRDGEQS